MTGAGSGIGRAITHALAKAGIAVALAGRRSERLKEEADAIRAAGGRVLTVPADVSRPAEVERLFQAVEAWAGGLDILVTNAAINPGRGRGVLEADLAQWDEIMAVNLRGPLLCVRAAVPLLRRRPRGWIIGIGSVGSRTIPDNLNPGYRASKFALRALMRSMAHELKREAIAVSLVMPGSTATDMLGGEGGETWLRPDDVAKVVMFLAALDPRIVVPEVTVAPRSTIGGAFCPYT